MNKPKALINGRIYSGYQILDGKALLINGEKIGGLVEVSDVPENYDVIDVFGANICPGLIDMQVYGAGEDLFSSEMTSESIDRIEEVLLRQGCTTFYLTLATNTIDLFKRAIAIFKSKERILAKGLHLEGPFLNKKKKGAHPEDLIVPISVNILADLLKDSGNVVKIITIAPELADVSSIKYLEDHGILISAGHSNASFEQSTKLFNQGIKVATHLWNAMSSLHHRDMGLPGAILNHDKVCASIVVDGIHVSYETVKLSKKMMGERLFLITDAVAECRKGIYQHVLNEDHYTLPDGTLSGSSLSMLQAVANCVKYANIDLSEAIRMATLYPARLMNLEDLGVLEQGSVANITVFDEDFHVKFVFLHGKQVV